MRHPLIKLFQLSSLLQIPNGHRMVDVDFSGTFSCSYNSINFNEVSQLVIVNFQRPDTVFLIFKPLVLESPLHCTFISSSWVKCTVDVASCLLCFKTHFELEKKCSNLLFV